MANRLKGQRAGRFTVQGAFTLLTNGNLKGFLTGTIYRGPLKNLCVPGLNCYSCPGAFGSCPIGAMQAVASSPDYTVSLLVLGFLTVVGALIGRVVCGFLCPFGWVQDLLHTIPTKKFSTRKLHPLTWLKYGILAVFVLILPVAAANPLGIGDPTFCKFICPQGVLEGALPLVAVNQGIRASLGALFTWKLAILLAVVVLAVFLYRPFCKWLCPLGAIYGLFNRFAFYRYRYESAECIHCGKCTAVCKMDVDPMEGCNGAECIRCGDCIAVCPTGALKKPTLKGYKGLPDSL